MNDTTLCHGITYNIIQSYVSFIALQVKPLKVTRNLRKAVMHFRDTRL